MRLRLLFRLLTLPLVLLPGALLWAQSDGDTESSIRRYTVEIIIFSYNQNVSVGSETFPADEPPVPYGEGGLQEIEILTPVPAPHEIVLLDDSEYTMGAIYDRLRRLDVYKPLMHFGWTQALLPDVETRPQPLAYFARPPAELDGELTLYLSRYLHLVVDLELAGSSSSAGPRNFTNDPNWHYPLNYRINENRIIRNGELRYFDHPKFGVLAKTTRVEETEPATEPEAQEMLGE